MKYFKKRGLRTPPIDRLPENNVLETSKEMNKDKIDRVFSPLTEKEVQILEETKKK